MTKPLRISILTIGLLVYLCFICLAGYPNTGKGNIIVAGFTASLLLLLITVVIPAETAIQRKELQAFFQIVGFGLLFQKAMVLIIIGFLMCVLGTGWWYLESRKEAKLE